MVEAILDGACLLYILYVFKLIAVGVFVSAPASFFSQVYVCARFNVCLIAFHVCFNICMLTCNVFQYVHSHFLCVSQYVLANCGGGGWSLVARELSAHLPCCLAASQLDAPVHLPTSLFRSAFYPVCVCMFL